MTTVRIAQGAPPTAAALARALAAALPAHPGPARTVWVAGARDAEARACVHAEAPEATRRLAERAYGALVAALGAPDGGVWAGGWDELRDGGIRLEVPPRADVSAAARALAAALAEPEARAVDIWHEVPLVPQVTGMSCWAAAAAMIVGWRDCVPVDPEALARGAGRWEEYQIGLLPDDLDTLCRAWGLVAEAPGPLTVERLRGLLDVHGPLWIGEADPGLHVIVLTGLTGDGTPEGTVLRVCDPWPVGRGERYSFPFVELARNVSEVTRLAGTSARILRSGRPAARRGARA